MRRAAAILVLFALSCSTPVRQAPEPVPAGKARFTVITPECIRMEYSETGRFIDEPSLLAVNRTTLSNCAMTRDGNAITLDTGRIHLTYVNDGAPFGPQNLSAIIRDGGRPIEWRPGQENRENLGGTVLSVDMVSAPVDLGEGVLSRDGWYLLDDSRRLLLVDGWAKPRPADAGTDWYLFGYGRDYKAGLRAMTAVAGPVPMPRKYALGAWYSRYWPYSSADYRGIVEEYRQHDFPLDVMVMDMDWHKDGWTGWSWNRKLHPDAEELLQWFHQQGLAVTLNVHPGGSVEPHEDAYEAFMKALGEDAATKKTVEFDIGNRRYNEALFNQVHAPLERDGVDFWWLDWPVGDSVSKATPGLPDLMWFNRSYFQHTARQGRRGISFSRWGGWGDHRNPIHFSGDAIVRWEMLEFEVPFTSTAGNVGCYYWSHDIGAHVGPHHDEMYARWVQFGSMSAALRSHSSRDKELDRRPWLYGKEAEASMRTSFHLRSELFPYIYSSVWQSHSETVPLIRAMYLEYPSDERAYRNGQQYLLGNSLLVAPIASPGMGPGKVALQEVWFPEGRWYNWFTGERYAGDTEAVVAADLDEFPVYVKGGVPIPLQPYTPRMTTTPLRQLVVRCYPGEEGRTLLYEDDGVSDAYRRGAHATTELRYSRRADVATVTIGAAEGRYDGQVDSRSYVVEFAGTRKAKSGRVDGRPAEVEFDGQRAVNRVRVPSRPAGEAVTVSVTAEEADFAALRDAAVARRLRGLLGGRSLEEVSDPELQARAWAVRGVAALMKNEAPYFFKGREVLRVHDDFHLITGPLTVTVEDRRGGLSRTVLRADIEKAAPARYELPALPQPTPADGKPTVRTARLEFACGDKRLTLTRVLERKENYLRKWSLNGDYPYDSYSTKPFPEVRYAPEEGPVDPDVPCKGPDGKSLEWKPVTSDETGVIDPRPTYKTGQLVYALDYVVSEEEQSAEFRLQADGSLEMWLNGEKVYSRDSCRQIDVEGDLVKVTLKKGANAVLLKVGNRWLGWRYRVALETGAPVRELLRKG